jgi:polyisoprenoid-binding protein YceI
MTTSTDSPTATVAPALPLAPGRWTLDHDHSAVHFGIRHLGLTNVRGRFARFDASLDVGAVLADVSVVAAIDMSSVDTNNDDRDAHLQSTDFFDTASHPTLAFRSTVVTRIDDDYALAGDLTINGVTRPVSLDVEFFGTEVYPRDQRTHAGFAATTTIRRSDFGIDFGLTLGGDKVLLGDKVKVELDLQFVAP